jgi:hypothetical protein
MPRLGALTALASECDDLRSQLTAVKDQLSREHRTSGTLRKLIAELSLELDQAREELAAAGNIIPLRARTPAASPEPRS